MSFIESQIKQRLQYDQEDFSDAFTDISRSVMSGDTPFEYKSRDRIEENSVNELLRYFGEKPVKIPDDIKAARDKIDYACAPHGIMHRTRRACRTARCLARSRMCATYSRSGTATA